MSFESEKTMFEIYREAAYSGRFRVIYFTELQEENKDVEINRAMAGNHVFDGFLRNYGKENAKQIIERLLDRMNDGEALGPAEIQQALGDHLA